MLWFWLALIKAKGSLLLVDTENRFLIGCIVDRIPSYWCTQKINPSHWSGDQKDDSPLAVSLTESLPIGAHIWTKNAPIRCLLCNKNKLQEVYCTVPSCLVIKTMKHKQSSNHRKEPSHWRINYETSSPIGRPDWPAFILFSQQNVALWVLFIFNKKWPVILKIYHPEKCPRTFKSCPWCTTC